MPCSSIEQFVISSNNANIPIYKHSLKNMQCKYSCSIGNLTTPGYTLNVPEPCNCGLRSGLWGIPYYWCGTCEVPKSIGAVVVWPGITPSFDINYEMIFNSPHTDLVINIGGPGNPPQYKMQEMTSISLTNFKIDIDLGNFGSFSKTIKDTIILSAITTSGTGPPKFEVTQPIYIYTANDSRTVGPVSVSMKKITASLNMCLNPNTANGGSFCSINLGVKFGFNVAGFAGYSLDFNQNIPLIVDGPNIIERLQKSIKS